MLVWLNSNAKLTEIVILYQDNILKTKYYTRQQGTGNQNLIHLFRPLLSSIQPYSKKYFGGMYKFYVYIFNKIPRSMSGIMYYQFKRFSRISLNLKYHAPIR
jgi:glucan phosphorylase